MKLELVREKAKFRRKVSRLCFEWFEISFEDLIAVNMAKKEVKLIMMMYMVTSILNLSKTFTFEFHYNKMMIKYSGSKRIKLLTAVLLCSLL